MTVTPNTDRRTLKTEIDLSLWLQEWEKKGAFQTPLFHGVNARQAATEMWEYLDYHDECAELYLALPGKEHTWGTATNSVLHRGDTRSLINARSIRHPKVKGQLYYDPVRKSTYAKYRNVIDSLKDAVYRFNEPGYAYDGVYPLGDFIAVIAPKEDSNDPEGYAWWVANYINGLRSRMGNPLPGGDMPGVLWVPADRNHYRPGRVVAWPDIILLHHTDGFDSLFWLTKSPNSSVSAHYLMNHDGSPRAQLVRHADTAWTTGFMNSRSISIEWERYWREPAKRQHPAFVPESVYRKLGKHVADIVRVERLRGNPNFSGPFERSQIGDHNDYYSTICPGNLDIDEVYQVVVEELEGRPDVPDDVTYFPETGKVAYGGFRSLYRELMDIDPALWARLMGYPMLNEGWAMVDGKRVRAQRWQKAWTIWNQQLADPFDITFMNLDEAERLTDYVEEEVV